MSRRIPAHHRIPGAIIDLSNENEEDEEAVVTPGAPLAQGTGGIFLFTTLPFTQAALHQLHLLRLRLNRRRPPPHRGASNETIAGLRTRFLPRNRKAAAMTCVALGTCCICMEEYKAGQKVCTLPCTHSYHFGCCKKWLKKHAICCVCRASVGSVPDAAGTGGN